MQESDEIKELLIEIRDVQREQLTEYRKVTQRSLELQQQAVTRQEQIGRLYRRVVVAAAILVVGLVILLIYLMGSSSSIIHCDLKSFFAAMRRNSLPRVFENLAVPPLRLSGFLEV